MDYGGVSSLIWPLDINTKCCGYFLVSTFDNYILMCKYNHLDFVFYDFNDALSNVIENDGMLESVYFKLGVVDLVNSILIILCFPNMDSIHDVFWMR